MPVWKNPCLLCGCGISVYWPNCTCDCHKNNMGTVIAWNNEKVDAPTIPVQPLPQTTVSKKEANPTE